MDFRQLLVGVLAAHLAACAPSAPKPQDETSEPAAAPASEVFAWPAALKPFGDGYPTPGDPCRRLGESALTVDFLDDSALLVGCPGAAGDGPAAAILAAGGTVVGAAQGVTMISIPQGDANAGMAEAVPN